jgi:hypothetical protein
MTRFFGLVAHLMTIVGDYNVAISKKPDELEHLLLRFYFGQLRENAGLCSRATNVILHF